MNLVRLCFIFGMIGIAGYALYLAMSSPYHEPVAMVAVASIPCVWQGGKDNIGYIVVSIAACASALTVAGIDLVRRVY